jgi:hypothetical protein
MTSSQVPDLPARGFLIGQVPGLGYSCSKYSGCLSIKKWIEMVSPDSQSYSMPLIFRWAICPRLAQWYTGSGRVGPWQAYGTKKLSPSQPSKT